MDPDKFARVLALAESDHPGEAQSALRAARLMLARAGLSFRDLTPRVVTVPPAANNSGPDPQHPRQPLQQLEQRLELLQRQLERQQALIRRQAQDLERWRTIARETAEQLWISGQKAARHTDRPSPAARRQAVVDTLNDPAGARLSDREIARRIGVPVSRVSYWRWRLKVAGHRRRGQVRPLPRGWPRRK